MKKIAFFSKIIKNIVLNGKIIL